METRAILDLMMLYKKAFFTFAAAAPKICLYKILNVSTDASTEQIKSAYFELAKKYHPDANFNSELSPDKFREIQEAYSVLSSEDKRRYYDQENGTISRQSIRHYWPIIPRRFHFW